MRELLSYQLFEMLGSPITPGRLILVVILVLIIRIGLKFLKAFVFKTLKQRKWFDDERGLLVYRIARAILMLIGVLGVIYALDLGHSWQRFLDFELISAKSEDGLRIEVRMVLTFLLVLFLAHLIIRLLMSLVSRSLEANPKLDNGQRFTVKKLIKYGAYVIAFIIAANSAGVNLNALLVGSAALLVGVGLGMQHLFDDFISGFVLLFEGTFQVGDVIEFDGLVARVVHIDIRTSKIVTRDGNMIIVPNRKLTSENLMNWSHGSLLSRFHIAVGVAYGSNVELVKKLLYQAALEHPDVSREKPIIIRFEDFGESSLDFKLFFWADRSWDIEIIRSDIRFTIDKSFRENGVQVPFPQRDLHLRSSQIQSKEPFN